MGKVYGIMVIETLAKTYYVEAENYGAAYDFVEQKHEEGEDDFVLVYSDFGGSDIVDVGTSNFDPGYDSVFLA